MKKTLFLLMMLATGLHMQAQTEVGQWTLTPRVGLNIAKLTDPDVWVNAGWKMEYGTKVGLAAGAEAEYRLSPWVAVSAALLYSNQGSRVKDNPVFRNNKVTLHYLNVPLTAKAYLTDDFAVRAGVQLGWAVKRKITLDEADDHGQWQHSETTDTWYRPFDLSIPLGIEYNIGRLQLDATYSIGVTNATKCDLMKMHNRVLQLTVGYRFDLQR